ncbi:MAG: hypothetical protein U1A27_00370 [Phycisphaerae bacterium]
MSRNRSSTRRGAARIEVMVLLAALCSVGLMTRAWTQVVGQGSANGRCLNNLMLIGQASTVVAQSDPQMILHRQSRAGDLAWRGLGAWDWGGKDGACGEFRADWPIAPLAALSAVTRPYNSVLVGDVTAPHANFEVFRCPSDTGSWPNEQYMAAYYEPTPCTTQEADAVIQRFMDDAVGTSYQGDFIWFGADFGVSGWIGVRVGSFMRPAWAIPKPDETLLFAEHRMFQAIMSTQEYLSMTANSTPPGAIPGWHAEPLRHNALTADGHVQRVEIQVSGSIYNPTTFPEYNPLFTLLLLRGPGWRYDCLPEGHVYERGGPYDFAAAAPPNDGPTVGLAGTLQTRARLTTADGAVAAQEAPPRQP